MKTFVVPIDFSETAKNAAVYAVQLAAGIKDAQVILYNAYDEILAGSDGTPLHDEEGIRKNLVLMGLKNVLVDLPVLEGVTVTCEAEVGTVIKNLNHFSAEKGADLIIMGITGSTRLDQVLMGSTTLNVVHHVNLPVMIIPPDARYKGFKNVVLTSDFKDVAQTTPFDQLTALLNLFKTNLHIMNVDSEHYVEVTEAYRNERVVLEEKLGAFNPDFSFLRTFDFIEGINRFVIDRNIDAIITIPKKHGFLTNLFKTSHTKKLAYHSHVPIIAVHA